MRIARVSAEISNKMQSSILTLPCVAEKGMFLARVGAQHWSMYPVALSANTFSPTPTSVSSRSLRKTEHTSHVVAVENAAEQT